METTELTHEQPPVSPDEALAEIQRWESAVEGINTLEQNILAESSRLRSERTGALAAGEKQQVRELNDGLGKLGRELEALPEMRQAAAAKLAEAQAVRRVAVIAELRVMLAGLEEQRKVLIARALATRADDDLLQAYLSHRQHFGLHHDLTALGEKLGWYAWSLGCFGLELERAVTLLHTSYKWQKITIQKPWEALLEEARSLTPSPR